MIVTLHLGSRCKLADGSYGRVTSLRRASIDGVVRDQAILGPDVPDVSAPVSAFMPGTEPPEWKWTNVEELTVLVPLDYDDELYQLRSKLTDASLALLRKQVEEKTVADSTDLALRVLLDLLPLIDEVPIPANIAAALKSAARDALAYLAKVL